MKHSKRLNIYKLSILFFMIIVFLLPGMLVHEAEIDNRALVVAIGIDVDRASTEGGILASAQVLVPVPQGQQAGRQEVFFGSGETLAEALAYINVKIGRILDFGQVGVIVFGKEKAEEGVLNELKYLINNKVRAESLLFVSKEGEAREVLEAANNLSEEVTSSLNNLLKFNAQSIYMPNINMLQFISDCNICDSSSYIPILHIAKKKGDSQDEGGSSEGNSTETVREEDKINEIKSVDSVFLFKDAKIKAKLTSEEARGLVWLNKEANFGLICAKNVIINEDVIDCLPCTLRKKSAKISARLVDGRPSVVFTFNLKFNSEDLHQVNQLNVDNSKDFNKVVNSAIRVGLENAVIEDIERCFSALKRQGVDAYRIRQQFYKFFNKKYNSGIRDDDNFLNDVDISYKFKIKVY